MLCFFLESEYWYYHRNLSDMFFFIKYISFKRKGTFRIGSNIFKPNTVYFSWAFTANFQGQYFLDY